MALDQVDADLARSRALLNRLAECVGVTQAHEVAGDNALDEKASPSQVDAGQVKQIDEELRQRFLKLDAGLSAAMMEAEEEDIPHVMREMLDKVKAKRREYDSLKGTHSELRRKIIVRQAREKELERSQLLARSARATSGEDDVGGSNARKRMLEQAALLNQSRDITASLRRTTQMVAQELSRMGQAEQVLADDSKKIKSTAEEYDTYKSAANKSDGVLKSLQRQEKIDYMVMAGGFLFFLLVVAYIIYKRTIAWVI